MPSLQGVLAGLPGIAGFEASRQQNDQRDMSQLQQMGALQQILGQVQKQKQEQELRGVLAQSGGDPAKAVQALLQSGSPRALELAAKLQGAFTKPQGQSIGSGGLLMPGGNVVPPAARPEVPKTSQPTGLSRLMAERDALPQGDPRRSIFDNAIRKESETAKQITPTVVMPPQIQPLVPIIGPDGKPRLVERKDAVGAMPAATGAKAEQVEAGKADVDKDVMTLKAALDALNTGGGITSTEKGVLPNVLRWSSTTGPGQLLGTMGGTMNQRNRDVISQARPLLLRSIMNATGMSAKQLDSNAELKLWLSTATDPAKGYEANVQALNSIASKYGSGSFMESGQEAKGKISPARRKDDVPAGIDPKVWAVMTPEEKKLFKQ